MKTFLMTAALALSLAAPVAADPEKDADYIVAQTVTDELFLGALTAQRPLVRDALTQQFGQRGIVISDMDRFMDIFFAEFVGEFTDTMRGEIRKLYLAEFSPDELSTIAEFYATPAGQSLVERTPELMLTLAQTGQVAGQRAGENAGGRVARRLEDEGISLDMERGTMDALLDFLR
ncbi:hypothetical protein So717_31440 [Roseobacter cerasinus]|uniref:DUF2059 domain-containing protein n=1 Tax=Roseobacter cerasinus TaxID=2602289 RepID=A0A640VWD6_9RHOB|nr:DUF2059 domain-containing protein [Roseobacter cerasinus]GFE51391.1 hypothetical protein So717_31440 [Roseobacter cerasinus]